MKYFPGCSNLEDVINYELVPLARIGVGVAVWLSGKLPSRVSGKSQSLV